ncbi:MAG: CPBP family intramembrane glutamic endopeptidase [Bacteroidota bacterium]
MTLPPLLYLISGLIVGLILPVYAVLTGKKAAAFLEAHPQYKLMVYQQTIAMQVILSGWIIGAIYWYEDDFAAIGLSFLATDNALMALGLLPLLFLYLIWKVPMNAERAAYLNRQYQAVRYLLPAVHREFKWSIPLSYVAGICEEIIYRGFLFWQLQQYFSWSIAILITNIVFAMGHYATRSKNMFFSFLFGLLWSFSFDYFGHLWWAMLTHVLIDLFAVTMGYKMNQFLQSNE